MYCSIQYLVTLKGQEWEVAAGGGGGVSGYEEKYEQRHIRVLRDRRRGTTAFPACWAITKCSEIRETRKGWPMLTVETEVNGDSKSTNERGPSLVGSFNFCSALAALVGPVQNILFLAIHYFNSFFPIAQQAGQAVSRAGSPVS
jgi:hypothetical protein